MTASPDEHYTNPRLAALYDPTDPDRSDLDVYAAIIDELGARSILDVGSGTGTLACMLALRGFEVVGLDPALASLDVARAKPGADRVRWIHGDATELTSMGIDIATMTGNVAQVFVHDDDWLATLRGIRRALRPGGRLVFETRDPARRAWVDWTEEKTFERHDVPGVGAVETWVDVYDVAMPLLSFRSVYRFADTGETLMTESTLRFRDRDEIDRSLATTGFRVDEVRDAPDRPGREFVFLATAGET